MVGDHVLHEVIGRLRRMLGDDARKPGYFETLPKRGYRLIAKVGVARRASMRRRGWGLVGALLAVASVTAWLVMSDPGGRPGVEAAAPSAIAVLPLENLSPDPADAYFSNAVTYEIWSRLTEVRGLRVISRTSAAAYANGPLDVREIGKRLTADFLIEGAAMRSGDLVRINVHLVDTRSGTEMWGTRRSGEAATPLELFALLDDVTYELAAALPDHVAGVTALAESARPDTASMAAYNLVQQAIFEMQRTGDPRASLKLAEQAVALDPDYWKSHQAVGAFHFWIAEFGWGPALPHLELARDSAERAVRLGEERSGEAYVVLGQVHSRLDPDFRRALAMYQRAETLGADPGYLTGARQDLLFAAGHYEAGVALLEEECARNPGLGAPLALLARFLYELGRPEDAKVHFDRALALSPDRTFVFRNVLSYYILRYGDLEGAERIIRESPLTARLGADRELALIAFLRGDFERYLAWFEIRVEERDLLGWIGYEPRERPTYRDYWTRLQAWAVSDPEHLARRLDSVREHRVRVDLLTEKMVL